MSNDTEFLYKSVGSVEFNDLIFKATLTRFYYLFCLEMKLQSQLAKSLSNKIPTVH